MRLRQLLRSRRILVTGLLGFSSGLPLYVTGQTLRAWMTAIDVDLRTIGVFSLVGLPYALKWAWAPVFDRYQLPFLGRRRGWLLVTQLALIAATIAMGTLDPRTAPGALAAAAVVVSFVAASQGLVIDALNADSLAPDERTAGSAAFIMGFKLGMLTTGALALALADRLPWGTIYALLAALLSIGIVGTALAREPVVVPPPSVGVALRTPFARLLSAPRAGVMLLFVGIYRLSDFFGSVMVIPYLKLEVGFTFPEIAVLYHVLGFCGTLIGGVFGSQLVTRYGLRRCLIAFGLFQGLTNLGWGLLGCFDRSLAALALVVLFDEIAGAMTGAVFVGFLMSRCDRSVSATQFALLTSLSSVGMHVFGFAAARLAGFSWPMFWVTSAALVIPGVLLVPRLPD